MQLIGNITIFPCKIKGDGQTPLHLAAALGDEALVKFFFLCKANPNIADKEG